MHSYVEVKTSTINGLGLFATKSFTEGDLIIQWDASHIYTKEAVEKMTEAETKYFVFVNDTYIDMQAPEKFSNHSCSPNAMSKDFSYVAIRDIAEGEEITIAYSKKLPLTHQCTCKNGKHPKT